MPPEHLSANQPAMTGKAETLPDISAECKSALIMCSPGVIPSPVFIPFFCHPLLTEVPGMAVRAVPLP